MSRPRTPFGIDLPGKLPATMVRVLAAEMSDQGRLSRGKRYWSDGAVVDIVIGHGAVTAEVQGGRPEPYVVTLEAATDAERLGAVPSRREVWVRCTCPDDAGTGSEACKHAVAALFALADEVSIQPDLLERWRQGGRAPHPGPATAAPAAAPVGVLADVIELRPRVDPDDEARRDQVAMMLRAPTGGGPPELGRPEPLDHPPVRNRALDDALRDALAHLTIRWE